MQRAKLENARLRFDGWRILAVSINRYAWRSIAIIGSPLGTRVAAVQTRFVRVFGRPETSTTFRWTGDTTPGFCPRDGAARRNGGKRQSNLHLRLNHFDQFLDSIGALVERSGFVRGELELVDFLDAVRAQLTRHADV